MKTLNPFIDPGSLKAERQQRRRKQLKIMVWTIVAANVVLFAGLLIQGCQQEPSTAETSGSNPAELASSDTNGVVAAPAAQDTNPPVAATPEVAPTDTMPEVTSTTAPPPVQAAVKQYIVVKGDSFYKIAKANGLSMKALTDANPGVDSAKLKIGQVLQLPAGAEPSAAVSTAPPTPAAATASQHTVHTSKAQTRYVVRSGDTLSRIARKHRTTVSALKTANGLSGDRIVAGQSLKMPET